MPRRAARELGHGAPLAQAGTVQARLAAVESTTAQAKAGPTIVVGTDADPGYPPFERLSKYGTFVGFDIDLVKAIGIRAGFTVQFGNYLFAALVTPPGVWASCGMVAAALTPTGDREQFMDYSDLYFNRLPYGPLAFAVPNNSAPRSAPSTSPGAMYASSAECRPRPRSACSRSG